ncbi:hypothetical protein PENTCL1PPCAC_21191, partial [Pristionchus entomophagus]
MQFLPYALLLAAGVLFLQAVASKPVHERLSRECNYHGHKENGKCVCSGGGITGDNCEKLETTMCDPTGERECGDNQFCLYKNIDCLYRDDCKDRRGWCLPLNHVSVYH